MRDYPTLHLQIKVKEQQYLKIPKNQSVAENQRRTSNTMVRRKTKDPHQLASYDFQ
jgi:hypothetical protein